MSDAITLAARDLEPERLEAAQVVTWLRDVFDVTDDVTMATAGSLVVEAKKRFQLLEARRTAITKPILASKRAIDDLFMPVLSALQDAERILKQKMGRFTLQREQERRALMVAAATQHQTMTLAGQQAPPLVIPAPAVAQGVSVRAVWDCEVTNSELVPRQYCVVDERLIRAQIPKDGPPQPIPGVRWFQREQVAVRTR